MFNLLRRYELEQMDKDELITYILGLEYAIDEYEEIITKEREKQANEFEQNKETLAKLFKALVD